MKRRSHKSQTIPLSGDELKKHVWDVKSLTDLDFLVSAASPELESALTIGLAYPSSPQGKQVATLVKTIAEIASTSSPESMVLLVSEDRPVAWRIIGKALGAREEEPARILAELCANRTSGEADRIRQLLKKDSDKNDFTQTLKKYRDQKGSPQDDPAKQPAVVERSKRQEQNIFSALFSSPALPESIATFDDLIGVVKKSSKMLQGALSNPLSSYRFQVAAWLPKIAHVVPDQPLSLIQRIPLTETVMWQLIGKALKLKEATHTGGEPARILAELVATTNPGMANEVRAALKTIAEKQAFTTAFTEYGPAGQVSKTPAGSLQPPVQHTSPPPAKNSAESSQFKNKRERELPFLPPGEVLPPSTVTLPKGDTTLPNLSTFVAKNATTLRQALDNPASDNGKNVTRWLKQITKVVPDQPLQLIELPLTNDVMWRIAGQILNLKEKTPISILAELVATKEGTTPDVAKDVRNKISPANRAKFNECLATYRSAGLPLDAPKLMEPPSPLPVVTQSAKPATKPVTQWKTTGTDRAEGKKVATVLLAFLHKRWRTTVQGSAEETAQISGPQYATQRAQDRLAWVLSMMDNRICASVLRRGRSIGVFANNPDDGMAKDLELLLSAARAEGAEADNLRKQIRDKIEAALPKMKWQPSPQALGRLDDRLRKVIAYLKDLERTQGRMGAVAYLAAWQVHAEMQAFLLSKAHGGGKLGISKQCCFKCYLVLTLNAAGVIDARQYLSHGKLLPWPMMKDLIENNDILANLLQAGGIDPATFLGNDDRKWAFFQALITEAALSEVVHTDFASPGTQPPLTPATASQGSIELHLEGPLTTDEEDATAFDIMLSLDELQGNL
ncbi:hypothetical protein ACQP2T_34890 [Nonomuraea sp. CA-143628]|uniref:hypothetical protein n=1 Tax=Nonomuraea sp. CA-143628 TaxID=3239997 RepID=UPI003D9448FF